MNRPVVPTIEETGFHSNATKMLPASNSSDADTTDEESLSSVSLHSSFTMTLVQSLRRRSNILLSCSFDTSRFLDSSSPRQSRRSLFTSGSFGSDYFSYVGSVDPSEAFSFTDLGEEYHVPTGYFGHDNGKNKRRSLIVDRFHSIRHTRSIRDHWVDESLRKNCVCEKNRMPGTHHPTQSSRPGVTRQDGVRKIGAMTEAKKTSQKKWPKVRLFKRETRASF